MARAKPEHPPVHRTDLLPSNLTVGKEVITPSAEDRRLLGQATRQPARLASEGPIQA